MIRDRYSPFNYTNLAGKLDHDLLLNYAANQHVVLPNTVANVLSAADFDAASLNITCDLITSANQIRLYQTDNLGQLDLNTDGSINMGAGNVTINGVAAKLFVNKIGSQGSPVTNLDFECIAGGAFRFNYENLDVDVIVSGKLTNDLFIVDADEEKIGVGSAALTQRFNVGGGIHATGNILTDDAITASGAIQGLSLDLGVSGASTGILKLDGSTSGTVTIQPANTAGTYTLTLPADDGDASQFLQTNGSGVLDWATAITSLSGVLLADGTVPLTADWNMGAFDLTGMVDITASGVITGGSLTDGTATLSSGNLTSMGNITGTDVDLSLGTGDVTTSGYLRFFEVTPNTGALISYQPVAITPAFTGVIEILDNLANPITPIAGMTLELEVDPDVSAVVSLGGYFSLSPIGTVTASRSNSTIAPIKGGIFGSITSNTSGGIHRFPVRHGLEFEIENFAHIQGKAAGYVEAIAVGCDVVSKFGSSGYTIGDVSNDGNDHTRITNIGIQSASTLNGTFDTQVSATNVNYNYGVKISTDEGSGWTYTGGTLKSYALYLSSIAATGNLESYGIWQNTANDNVLYGNTAIGSLTPPTETLEVTGTVSVTGVTTLSDDLVFDGVADGLTYGSLYGDNIAVTINTDGNWQEYTSGLTEGYTNNCTVITAHAIQVDKDGVYAVSWQMSVEPVTAPDSTTIEGGVMVDGTINARTTAHRQLSAGAGDEGSFSATCILDLNNGEEISLAIKDTGATTGNDIRLEHAQLTCIQIGGPAT